MTGGAAWGGVVQWFLHDFLWAPGRQPLDRQEFGEDAKSEEPRKYYAAELSSNESWAAKGLSTYASDCSKEQSHAR